ncbi:MAG: sialidase family protein, partial [Pirellulales bacterium]
MPSPAHFGLTACLNESRLRLAIDRPIRYPKQRDVGQHRNRRQRHHYLSSPHCAKKGEPPLFLLVMLCLLLSVTSALFAGERDLRDIRAGLVIPDEGYCDQPYVVITPDGNWLCTLTTGTGHEGQGGQHVASTISADQGKTWSPLGDIEPSSGPEASWVVPLVTPTGRVYVFYSYNGDRVDHLPGQSRKIRADMMGWYCFKYSDDQGRPWSKKRYRIPVRVTACDRTNDWKGKAQIFWGIDKPKIAGGSLRFAFTKLGRYMLEDGEGWMVHSSNLLTERDVERIDWELLPDGEHGIRAPKFGSTQEEHNHVAIGENRLYLVYRTTTGYPCHVTSDDGGHTWSKPE